MPRLALMLRLYLADNSLGRRVGRAAHAGVEHKGRAPEACARSSQ